MVYTRKTLVTNIKINYNKLLIVTINLGRSVVIET